MTTERIAGSVSGHPFPVYTNLVDHLATAHGGDRAERDPTVAHVLGVAAGYAYADLETMSSMMSRLGFDHGGCVRVAQTVDAMYIFSTAYLVQSRCGRVVILAYRGTEPANLGNWIADTDVGPAWVSLGAERLGAHAGFHRNVRATQWAVSQELHRALHGRCLDDPDRSVDQPMRALYVTGHSLGGAMALLSALLTAADPAASAVSSATRAVYTFGQPLTLAEPFPDIAHVVARKVFRHINASDLAPVLPPASWGRFAHLGHEYRYADGGWTKSEQPVAQIERARDLPRALLTGFGAGKSRGRARYSMADHPPHTYIAALRPKGLVTEFGDLD